MTPVQLFGVVVRTIGLFVIVYSTPRVFESMTLMGIGKGEPEPFAAFFVRGAIQLGLTAVVCIAGVWLLRGPKRLIAFAYPEEHGTARSPSPAAGNSSAAAH